MSFHRPSLVRIFVDLIKADLVIDSREIELYESLKADYHITSTHEEEAFKLTLAAAVRTLRERMTTLEASEAMMEFRNISICDDSTPVEEALLMLALQFCFDPSLPESEIISVHVEDTWFDDAQVLYVESFHHREVNDQIHKNYRTISAELKLCGLDFVYLPHVFGHFNRTPQPLFTSLARMLRPSLAPERLSELKTQIAMYKTDKFCLEQLARKLGFTELKDTPPSLLIHISRSRVDDKIVSNFLRINVDADPLATVIRIVDTFRSFHKAERLFLTDRREESGRFLYSGIYRQVFEIFLLQKNVTCTLRLDFVHQAIQFMQIDNQEFRDITRREKAFYALLLFEQFNSGGGAVVFTPQGNSEPLRRAFASRKRQLQRRYEYLYSVFTGDSAGTPSDIFDIKVRSQFKSRINKAVSSLRAEVYDIERFEIKYDTASRSYSIDLTPEMVYCLNDCTRRDTELFVDSQCFAKLASIS